MKHISEYLLDEGQFLVRKRKPRVAHIWYGKDTACRMYSTGGLTKSKYAVTKGSCGLSICTMCSNVAFGFPLDKKQNEE